MVTRRLVSGFWETGSSRIFHGNLCLTRLLQFLDTRLKHALTTTRLDSTGSRSHTRQICDTTQTHLNRSNTCCADQDGLLYGAGHCKKAMSTKRARLRVSFDLYVRLLSLTDTRMSGAVQYGVYGVHLSQPSFNNRDTGLPEGRVWSLRSSSCRRYVAYSGSFWPPSSSVFSTRRVLLFLPFLFLRLGSWVPRFTPR